MLTVEDALIEVLSDPSCKLHVAGPDDIMVTGRGHAEAKAVISNNTNAAYGLVDWALEMAFPTRIGKITEEWEAATHLKFGSQWNHVRCSLYEEFAQLITDSRFIEAESIFRELLKSFENDYSVRNGELGMSRTPVLQVQPTIEMKQRASVLFG